ncbi:MAG: dTDP-4-amino-4,6-dideoxygalactose transaminase [Ruminococcus sp.]|nr:dTDP-4-amino-4,6-dideoxygalactose transaminase [Ruminococcus sp.]
MRVPFNVPAVVGEEYNYIQDTIKRRKISGDNYYTKLCHELIESKYKAQKALLTTSCTHALELSALLCDIKPNDEVIMPSYTFVSTANAFALRGAKIVFVDIRPDTQNIDENLIEQAINRKTKAIVPVHYAGVACEMNRIIQLADNYRLSVVEDAAQGVNAYYNGLTLGTIGDFGCYSFHETKNYTMGEGGALLIRSEKDNIRSEIFREKGTNRAEFQLGMVDKYSWVSEGSSYLPSDINSAYLYAQLQKADEINNTRLKIWSKYYSLLEDLQNKEKLQLPFVPENCQHNAHMFYVKARSSEERNSLIDYLKVKGITAPFHYIPLHTSTQGRKCGEFFGVDKYTTDTSQKLLRLPLYFDLTDEQVDYVCEQIYDFYKDR